MCQTSASSRHSSRRMRARSRGARSAWSRAARQAVMSSYFWISVRRATSVGWAVSTSSMSSAAICRARLHGAWPAACRRTSSSASTRSSNGGASSGRRRRMRWYCSAMLARLRNWLKARTTGSSSSSVSAARVCSSSRAPSAEPRRAALAPRRMRSILARNASPRSRRKVSPSSSPSRCTSSRKRASISAMPALPSPPRLHGSQCQSRLFLMATPFRTEFGPQPMAGRHA